MPEGDDTFALDANDFAQHAEEGEQPAAPASDPSPDETPTDAKTDDDQTPAAPADQTQDKSPAETDETDSDSQTESSDADDTDTDTKPEAKNKAENRIRDLANQNRDYRVENRQLREEIARKNQEVYKPASEQDLIDQGYDAGDAKHEALEQKVKWSEYNAHVQQLNSDLNMEALLVTQEFPVFDKNSPEYDKELTEKVNAMYARAASIETDEKTGYVTNATLMPYDFYKTFADARTSGVKTGTNKRQQASDKNEAAAEVPSSAPPPKKAEKDPFEQGLEAVWGSA